jgi:hypothetical protein
LIPTFHEEILETLVDHSSNMTLPLAYFHSVQPTITSEDALRKLFSAIAKTSVTEAFFFSRGQADGYRQDMLQSLISFIVREPVSENAAARATELVNLPFSKEEEEWFQDYLIHGDVNRSKKARDIVMMRRIGTGKFAEALEVDCSGTRTVNGLNWEMMQEGIKEGLGPRRDVVRQ